jgi:hypothetical protein
MAETILCAICKKRKARRECPGVRGMICAQCCGAEREVTVDCPFDCAYLREARKHEKEQTPTVETMPFPGIEVSDAFLAEHEQFIGIIGLQMLRYALEHPKTTDHDLQAAMEKLVKTYETLSSGLYYESLPEEGSQIGLFREVKKFLDEYQEAERKKGSVTPLKEGDVIRSLAFLSRLAALRSNGRVRGRAFIDFLRQSYPEAAASKPDEPRLIVPGR